MISGTLGPIPKKNLAEISKMLTQIAIGEVFGDDNPCLQPLNSYVAEAIPVLFDWLREGWCSPRPCVFGVF
jgi:Ras GTPase-activating-like protein IQGAP2/3